MDWKNNKKTGYDLEELYFEKLNRELINKIKAEGVPGEGEKQTESTGAQVIPFRARERGEEKKAA